MKKTFYLLYTIILMMSTTTACSSDSDNLDVPVSDKPTSYEIKSDIQQPMSVFINNIPDEYAAFKEPMTGIISMREEALAQKLGKPELELGFRRITYLYPSKDVRL